MKKNIKYVLIFIVSFFCFLLFGILNSKFGLSRGIKQHTWQEIYSNLLLEIAISFFVALIFTFIIYAANYKNKKSQ